MTRTELEKAAWRNTPKDSRSNWNKGAATTLLNVPGKGTCLVPFSSLSNEELMARARLKRCNCGAYIKKTDSLSMESLQHQNCVNSFFVSEA